ncbi:hypothetical protein ACS0TY_003782 [Phlomoides rotata]
MDIDVAIKLLRGAISFLEEYIEHGFDNVMSEAKEMASQFKKYEETFGFLLNLERLRDMDDESLLRSCKKLQGSYTHNGCSDIDGDDLFSELNFLNYSSKCRKKLLKVEAHQDFSSMNNVSR